MNVSEAIQTKRAVRQFKPENLPDFAVNKILNAGRRAQSAKNSQPWHFIAVQEKQKLTSLSETGHFAGHIAGAALCIAIITPPPEQRFSIMFDAGQAAAYMQLAGWELGIGSCLATIYNPEQARQILEFPEELTSRIAISFGFPSDSKVLTKKPQKGGRRPSDNVIHWEKW